MHLFINIIMFKINSYWFFTNLFDWILHESFPSPYLQQSKQHHNNCYHFQTHPGQVSMNRVIIFKN